jgi:predicted alpha/beta superfamily hydrolase
MQREAVTTRLVILTAAALLCAGQGTSAPSPEPEAEPQVVFRIHVPQSTPEGSEIWVSGNHPRLGNWDGRGLRASPRPDGTYAARGRFPRGTLLEFKITRGSWETVEKDPQGAEIPNRRLAVEADTTLEIHVGSWRDQVEAPSHTLTGEFRFHRGFRSRFLSHARDLIVYLPPGYDEEPQRRYPVLYLQDGQNVFDAATSFLGIEWGVDETAEVLIRSGRIAPLIVVGIYNSPDRIAEYTHDRDPEHGGGRGTAYARFLVEELKPFVDATYRTLPDPQHTAVAGSSLGGLLALNLGLLEPEVFGLVGALSPSVWWADEAIRGRIASVGKTPVRIWLDIGTAEGSTTRESARIVEGVRRVRDALLARGWTPGVDLHYLEAQGAAHNEAAWAQRVPGMLTFLFPPEPDR